MLRQTPPQIPKKDLLTILVTQGKVTVICHNDKTATIPLVTLVTLHVVRAGMVTVLAVASLVALRVAALAGLVERVLADILRVGVVIPADVAVVIGGGCGGDMGDQVVAVDGDDGLGHGGVLEQCVFHLARLDPEPPELHLVIHPAVVVQEELHPT
ncbi:hypothetical protein, partial [Microbispora amethystogenes]|uniref:hypothetical protein n=1 Tax=Microbispora amethystogenes TaxID=1427754 RepID=UPI0031ECBDED